MSRTLPKYPLTLAAVLLLVCSFIVFSLGTAGEVPLAGAWRGMVIPAYLAMVIGAVTQTAVPAVMSVPYAVFMFIGVAVWLMPFVAADRIVRSRRHRRTSAI